VTSTPRAEDLPFTELVHGWNGLFKQRVFFSYARCHSCGLLFNPVFFNPEQLDALYAQMPANMDLVPSSALRRTQRGYFEALKARSDLTGGYVEIGPDTGLFAENCVREGHFERYWMFEPNRGVRGELDAALSSARSEIVHSMADFSRVPHRSVGAAVMIQVLDHLLDPVSTLLDLRDTLGDGSIVFIVTHNETSLLRRLFGYRWPAFCLQHPEIYNPRSMQALMAATGYDVVEIGRTTNHFPLQFLVKNLLWACGLKVGRVPSFGGISLSLKLGNMLTVATPRPRHPAPSVPAS
jgi:hypothetical protein